jgi:hypothetical protein
MDLIQGDSMSLEDGIKNILFGIGKDVKLHMIDKDNIILEIDYDRYTAEIMTLFKEYLEDRS